MKHVGKIVIDSKNSNILIESIKPELKKNVSNRSEVKIRKIKDKFIIYLQSEDINALRAVINNILRLVQSVEKTIKIK